MFAVEAGHKEIVEFLVRNLANIDGDEGYKEVVDLLIRNVVDVNIKNKNYLTPLEFLLRARCRSIDKKRGCKVAG